MTEDRVYLGDWAVGDGDRVALVIGDGEESYTYRQLDERSNQVAHGMRSLGLNVGDGVAMMLDNSAAFVEVWWAGMRAGIFLTPINWRLTAREVRYLLLDSGAKAVFVHARLLPIVAAALADRTGVTVVVVDGTDGVDAGPVNASAAPAGMVAYEELVGSSPTTRLSPEVAGGIMFYSSGTTGQPKGIRPPLSGGPPDDGTSLMRFVAQRYGVPEGARYLSTGPLYHSAPISWTTSMHTIGSTAVVMRRFDAEEALRIIDHQRITHVQFVPTMFQRILNLPADVRARYDLTSLQAVWHAAAPCSVHLKRAMIDLFGPILWEYYAGSEGGGTIISSPEWLERPGSVGRHWTNGTIRVLDPVSLAPLPAGEPGLVYFEPVSIHRFRYHNDPTKTDAAYHDGLFTLGDIGYLDAAGYLFLTDRKSNTIISGGVNIYPQEIEDVLTEHPAVTDAAVFGVPDEEYGEQVLAVVELVNPGAGSPALAADLNAHCRDRLAGFKVPRRMEFTDALPRDNNGKLYKRRLRDQYWDGHDSKLV